MNIEVSRDEDRQLLKVYRALGERSRLNVLRVLKKRGELNCSEVRDELGLTPSTMSHHVALLEDCGLIDVRRQGTFRILSLREEVLQRFAPAVL